MSNTITLNPFTRIEGHQVGIDGGRVTNVFISGEMFRGFEIILRGHSPLDAQHIIQRICCVCPVNLPFATKDRAKNEI